MSLAAAFTDAIPRVQALQRPSHRPTVAIRSADVSVRACVHARGFEVARESSVGHLRSRSPQPRNSKGGPRSIAVRAAGPGGGVIDRPTTAKPGVGEKNVTKKKKPPMYRVMLHNDTFNRREYVVQVLLKVIDGLTMDDAVNVMQKAHIDGLACVISCPQEDAEQYCEGLRTNGLISSVEPDS